MPTPALEPLAALQQQLERRVVATRDLHAASSASLNLADSAPNLATHQRALPSTAAATAPARAEPPLSSKKPRGTYDVVEVRLVAAGVVVAYERVARDDGDLERAGAQNRLAVHGNLRPHGVDVVHVRDAGEVAVNAADCRSPLRLRLGLE